MEYNYKLDVWRGFSITDQLVAFQNHSRDSSSGAIRERERSVVLNPSRERSPKAFEGKWGRRGHDPQLVLFLQLS